MKTAREIAEILLKNAVKAQNPHCYGYAEDYLNNPPESEPEHDKEIAELTSVFECIAKDGYDISGFVLYEVPIWYCYCFSKDLPTGEIQNFDILTEWEGKKETVMSYCVPDVKDGIYQGGLIPMRASSIAEAIEKYDWGEML